MELKREWSLNKNDENLNLQLEEDLDWRSLME
jgi:hypothetical protein